jgi:NAD(P) transhydrogenase subunit beta
MPHWLVNVVYLVCIVLFVFGIKGMTHPRTARRGNLMSSGAMLLAIVVTLAGMMPGVGWPLVLAGLIVGATLGAVLALWIRMEAMPQLVALFNGLGGGASVFVAWAALTAGGEEAPALMSAIATAAAGLIGAVTFWGSLVAVGKLQELDRIKGNVLLPGHQALNALLLAAALALAVWSVLVPGHAVLAYSLLVVVATALGITLVLPIGGADMPVVVALLNSYSGLAAAATGFVIANNVLIIAGSLVGASGLILTAIMCKAMNRSLTNVLFGRIEAGEGGSGDEMYEGQIKSTSAEELAMMLESARRVAIIPGYGMAVAQAQHAVRDLFQLMTSRGQQVEFGIHPVAGRMPGHMNVLLAEVDIPYDKLIEMEQMNPQFEQVDLAIVIGANDVVNPDARNSDSPIAGMPIMEVDKARTVVVVKRSLSPGYAGIANPLFTYDNTLMYFADGKQAITDLGNALKED